jgi:hypothetical protein
LSSNNAEVIEMLYQDKALGRPSIARRVASTLRAVLSGRRQADLDLLSVSPHLRRDLGLEQLPGFAGEIWRK